VRPIEIRRPVGILERLAINRKPYRPHRQEKAKDSREKREDRPGHPVFWHKTGWGHPLCGTNVSLYRIHFHRYWTGVRFRFVEVPEVSAALNAPVGLPILCHK